MTRFFIRLLNYTLLACFFGFIWGGWYLSKQGFGRKWRKKLSEEFAKRGVELTAKRLTLDPLRGLVARNVRVYRDSYHRETIAIIDELRLDINYTRLLRKEPFLDALILSEAEVMLDVDPRRANSGEFAIHHLAAQLYFEQDKLDIRRLEGEGLGLNFSIRGVVAHRPDWQSSSASSDLWQPLQAIPQDWLQKLAEIKFGKNPGRLDLCFRGNLSQKHWLQSADGHLELPDLHWRGLRARDISIAADFTDHLLTVRRLGWRDDHGAIAVSGDWHPGVEGHLRVDSQVNAPAIFYELNLFPELSAAAKIQLTGDVTWSEAKFFNWQIVGKMDARKLVWRDVPWSSAQMEFSVTPHRWFVRDAHWQQKDGEVTGQFLHDDTQFTAELDSTVDPRLLARSLGKSDALPLAEFDFAVNPLLKMKITTAPGGGLQTDGEVVFGRTNFRGVAFTSAQASFSQLGANVALSQIQITRPEGQLTGESFWNQTTGELALWSVKNSVDLVALGLWLDGPLAEAVETMQLPRGTTFQADGRLRWTRGELSEIAMQVRSPEVAVFELPILASLAKTLPDHQPAFQVQAGVTLENHRLQLDSFTGTAGDRQLSGHATWSLTERKFAGLLDDTGTTWNADAPWHQVQWRESGGAANP
ncbi:MAG: hypothetical protein ABIT76_15175 [Chthoniobacterales bacterium]